MYFDEVPKGWRKATYSDFFNDSGRPVKGKPFLLKLPSTPERPVRYYAYRTQPFDMTLFEFLVFYTVYVLEEKSS
jgi:hypothetical protein